MSSDKLPRCDFQLEDTIFRLEKIFPADVGATEEVVGEIMATISDMKCINGKEFEIELALREALANAIEHGCAGDCTKRISVCVACSESSGVLLVVRDPGSGFDPSNVPSPVVGSNIYSSHGRGIYLINQLMDEVSFEKGGTEIRMIKRK